MRLDDWLILLTIAVCCGVATFDHGQLFQTCCTIVVIGFVIRAISKRQSQIQSNIHGTRSPSIPTSSGSNCNNNNSINNLIASSTQFVPVYYFGGAGLIFPALLIAEKVYHHNHSVGFNTLSLYTSLIWLWVALTEEERIKIGDMKHQQKGNNQHNGENETRSIFLNGLISVDRHRFELFVTYTVGFGVLFSLMTMNVYLGLGSSMFLTSAYIAETLLRTLFHQYRISIRSSQNNNNNASAIAALDVTGKSELARQYQIATDIRVIDSEIHLVSTFVGWFMCEFASNPFQENSIATSTSRRTVVTASPEMVVGRTMLVAAWVGIVGFSLYNYYHQQQQQQQQQINQQRTRNNNSNNSTSETASEKPTTLTRSSKLFQMLALISFVGVFSLLLTGWTCADCFPYDGADRDVLNRNKPILREEQPPSTIAATSDEFVKENQRYASEEGLMTKNVTIKQRIERTLLSFKDLAATSTKFRNPVWIWYKLIFEHYDSSASSASASSSSTKLSLFDGSSNNIVVNMPHRLFWMVLWAISVPILSAFPFIIQYVSPSTHYRVPRIVWRKWFHFVAVTSFVVATTTDGSFMALAWCGALALAALIEVGRVFDVPPFDKLTPLLESVTDDRDAIVLRTHWYLMLGCALPVIFFHRCVYFWSDNPHWLVHFAVRILPGLGCLGVGDALSAVVGTLYGGNAKAKWASLLGEHSKVLLENPVIGKKSRVGTLYGGFLTTFGIVAVCFYVARLCADRMVGLPFTLENKILIFNDVNKTFLFWIKCALVLGFGSIFETVSGGVDNLEVPLLSLAVTFLMF